MAGDFDRTAFDPSAFVTDTEEPPAGSWWAHRPYRPARKDSDDDLLITVLL